MFAERAGISPKRFLQYVTCKEHARQALRAPADILGTALAAGLSGPSRLHDLMISREAMAPGEIKTLDGGVTIGFGCAPIPFGEALLGWTARGVCYFEFHDGEAAIKQLALQTHWQAAMLVRDDGHAGRCWRGSGAEISNPYMTPVQLSATVLINCVESAPARPGA